MPLERMLQGPDCSGWQMLFAQSYITVSHTQTLSLPSGVKITEQSTTTTPCSDFFYLRRSFLFRIFPKKCRFSNSRTYRPLLSLRWISLATLFIFYRFMSLQFFFIELFFFFRVFLFSETRKASAVSLTRVPQLQTSFALTHRGWIFFAYPRLSGAVLFGSFFFLSARGGLPEALCFKFGTSSGAFWLWFSFSLRVKLSPIPALVIFGEASRRRACAGYWGMREHVAASGEARE